MNIEKPSKTIVNDCLKVKKGEKVLIITDKNLKEIANEIYNAAKEITEAHLIEIPVGKVNGEEPPEDITKLMQEHDVLIIPTSKSLTHTNAVKNAITKGARGATLPGITKDMMLRAIDIDYNEMKENKEKLKKILDSGKEVHIKTKAGTDLRFSIKERKAKSCTGIINKGEVGNLPAGEVFIAPVEETANGKLIIDGSLLNNKVETPIEITIKDGFAAEIKGEKEAEELKKALESVNNKNAFNVAELGIGINPNAIITGNVLEDEKVLGTCHIAFGKNSSFGGKIDIPIHIDCIIKDPTILIDDKEIMNKGKFV